MMERKKISQHWMVSEILQKHPGTSRILLEKKTFCVGCYMARFCNLKDVAHTYSLDIETLVHEIQQAAINKPNQNAKE